MAAIVNIELPMPPMGGKIWLLESKGIFVLERGPGTLRTLACTHAGSGMLVAIDGVPDENGFFPEISNTPAHNGRPIYRANPVVMGSWMLDGGFVHGLTIRAEGGNEASLAIASIVWAPVRGRK